MLNTKNGSHYFTFKDKNDIPDKEFTENNLHPKEITMCQNCQQPVKLQDKPKNCSPEQIRECHGDVKGHPCREEKAEPKSK